MRSLIPKWGCLALLAAGTALLVAGPAAASNSPVVGHVYVNDNTALRGSPFAAGGAGSGSGLSSQGAI